MTARVRTATTHDAKSIAAIYNHYISTSNTTFDTDPKSVEDRVEWIAERGDRQPILVVEIDDVVVGWGSVSLYATRPAWGRTVEIGIYIDPAATGAGLGMQLGEALIEAAQRGGYHALIAQIVADNTASVHLMERLGFERVGYLREVGSKFGRLHDVVLFELLVQERFADGGRR
ncbi:MAG: GNAT family N-acetyltransferase [Actinomycetota bacterium]|nr:GNAT family N-acetyltransferase [Actinomycetota bacterium]